MRKIALSSCLLLLLGPVWAQKINMDSLVRVAISMNSNMKPQAAPNRDSLLKQLPFIKSPAARIQRIYDLILNYGQLNPKEALYYHHKILDLTRKNNDPVGESVILSELGATVAKSGDNVEGVKIVLEALKLAEKTGNNQAIGIAYNNLGRCYDNVDLQKRYFLKALKFSQAGNDDLFTCYALGNLGAIYQWENKKDSATYYLSKTFELSVRKNLQQIQPGNFTILAQLQTTVPNKIKYLNIALNLPFTKVTPHWSTQILSDIAETYLNTGQTDSGLFYANRAYQAALHALYNERIDPAGLLAELYKGRNADSTLKYTNIYYQARDSAFNIEKVERAQSLSFAAQQREQETATQKQAYQTTMRTYLLTAIILFFVILAFVFWRNNRQKQKANYLLTVQKEKIETQRDSLGEALDELKAAQNQLVQREKMASLGELTAGIAHEIQNPLNFVNNFSEVNQEMLDELDEELNKGDIAEAKAIAADIRQNEQKISHHGKRADSIVKGMLEHSRSRSGQKEPTDINTMADEFLRLSYHGLRSKDKSFNAELVTNFDAGLPKINVVQQDIGRVLLNLFNNAFYAVNQKQKTADAGYKPEVSVTTSAENGQVVIKVKDNGIGIPDAIKEKIMQPFFTTKPTGEGTGLGLSLTYDMVVKGHGGSISVDTREGCYTEFTVSLPL
jgi:two-component system NtrC family sensor kinase